MSEWLPMESAPKNGMLVFAWHKDWELPAWVQWRVNSRTLTAFWNDVWEQDHYDNEDNPPTHWHPIAVPPGFAMRLPMASGE